MSLLKNILKFNSVKTSLNSCYLSTSTKETFKFDDLQLDIRKTKPDLPDDPSKLLFGSKFTDHMFSVEWDAKEGWGRPKIGPFKNLEIHPAAKCLHYSIEIFEGMKAYKGVDDKIRLFRPDLNLSRLHRSAARSTLPVLFILNFK